MGISHVAIYVEDGSLDKMIDWYLTVLAPLGYKKLRDLRPYVQTVGLGAQYADFWIAATPGHKHPSEQKLHVAFVGTNRQAVREFHALAMKLGSKDNGAPGLRPLYAPTYYGAFVFDPEGRNIEVHTIAPAFWSEPKQKVVVLAVVGVIVAVGLSYFANIDGYLSG